MYVCMLVCMNAGLCMYICIQTHKQTHTQINTNKTYTYRQVNRKKSMTYNKYCIYQWVSIWIWVLAFGAHSSRSIETGGIAFCEETLSTIPTNNKSSVVCLFVGVWVCECMSVCIMCIGKWYTIYRWCSMSSVSTWSFYLRESCNLHIGRRESRGDETMNSSVLKRALDPTYWRTWRPWMG